MQKILIYLILLLLFLFGKKSKVEVATIPDSLNERQEIEEDQAEDDMTEEEEEEDTISEEPIKCTQAELVENLNQIYDEMQQRQITQISYDDPATSDLFQQLYTSIWCEWFEKGFIDGIQQKGEFSSHYNGMYFAQTEAGYDYGSYFGPYYLGFTDCVGCDSYFNVKAFRIDPEEKKFEFGISNTYYEDQSEYATGTLDFSDEHCIKVSLFDVEYVYIDTDITNFINQTVFVGRYQDQNGIAYEFKDNCEAVFGDQSFFYNPFILRLDIGFNAIELEEDHPEYPFRTIGFEFQGDKLCLYKLEQTGKYNNPEKCDEPFAVLTKIE